MSPVDIRTKDDAQAGEILAVQANDWVQLPGPDLLRRLLLDLEPDRFLMDKPNDIALYSDWIERTGNALKTIEDEGQIIGRLAPIPHSVRLQDSRFRLHVAGWASALCSRGTRMQATAQSFAGVVEAAPTRAARTAARPLGSPDAWTRWASSFDPTDLESEDPLACIEISELMISLGSEPSTKPCIVFGGELTSIDHAEDLVGDASEILIFNEPLTLRSDGRFALIDWAAGETIDCGGHIAFGSMWATNQFQDWPFEETDAPSRHLTFEEWVPRFRRSPIGALVTRILDSRDLDLEACLLASGFRFGQPIANDDFRLAPATKRVIGTRDGVDVEDDVLVVRLDQPPA